MKKYSVTIIFIVFALASIEAQPPGGGGGRHGGQGGPPPEFARQASQNEDTFILEHFPEIPDITLEQREKVGSIISKERKDIEKQIEKKKEIEKKRGESENRDEGKKLEKIDKKIAEIQEKSNKKIKKVLSDTQYSVFLEKRNEFKFRPKFHQGRPRHVENDGGERPPRPTFENEGGAFE